LVQVKLSILNKGTSKEFAIICMPKLEDLRSFENNEHYDGPVHKHNANPNENSSTKLRRIRSMKLKRLSQRRVKRKKTFQGKVLPEKFDVVHDVMNRAKLSKLNKTISDREKEKRKLYLKESTEVRQSCDREVMGYVTMGGYSFLRAKGISIGYVALPSLLEIIR
ncbi:hypothetical protein EAG_09752, partial [Camponotus floridanus]